MQVHVKKYIDYMLQLCNYDNDNDNGQTNIYGLIFIFYEVDQQKNIWKIKKNFNNNNSKAIVISVFCF